MHTNVGRRHLGFTLVELLVVIAIIGILIALLLPAVQAAREAARRMTCSNHIKQLATAALTYEAQHRIFPVCIPHSDTGVPGNGISWLVGILPFIEKESMFDSLYLSGNAWQGHGICHAVNKTWIIQAIPDFYCPSDDAMGKTRDDVWQAPAGREFAVCNYAGVLGPHNLGNASQWGGEPDCHNYTLYGKKECLGTFWRHSILAPVTVASFTDGTSNTLIIGEALPEYDYFLYWALGNGTVKSTHMPLNWMPPWDPASGGGPTSPAWINWPNQHGFRSRHAGGAQFAYGDGHTRFVSGTIDRAVYRGLSTRAMDETLRE